MMITTSDAQRELDRHWAELVAAIDAIPEDELEKQGVVEEWSVKDIMGHIAFWAARAAATLQASTAGSFDGLVWGEGEGWVDEWNRREYLARKDRLIAEVRKEWRATHEQARDAIRAATDESLNAPFRDGTVAGYFVGDTYGHYKEHLEQIKAWVREMETTEK